MTAFQILIVCNALVSDVRHGDFRTQISRNDFAPSLCEEVETLISQYGVLYFGPSQGRTTQACRASARFGKIDVVKDLVVPGLP